MRLSLPFIAKLSFSLLLLAAVFVRIDVSKIPSHVASINPGMILLALLLASLQVPATSLRWHLLLRTVGVKLPLRTTIEVNILSIFANTVLINVIGGLVTRVGFLLNHQVSAHSIVSTTLLERAVIALVLGGMTFAGLMLSDIYPHLESRTLLTVAGLTLSVLVLVVACAYPISKRFRTVVSKATSVLLHTLTDIRVMVVDWRGLAVAFLLTLVSQLMLVAVGVLVGHIMHVGVPLLQMAMILPGVALISTLPVGLGGVGLREITMVTILGAMGVPAELALVLSVTIGAVTLAGTVLAYLVVLVNRRLRNSNDSAEL